MSKLTHISDDGRALMVDVTDKPDTHRTATASGLISMSAATLDEAINRNTKKGDPIAIAELAGIMAAKKTSDIIPLCHPLALTSVKVKINPVDDTDLSVVAQVKTSAPTGVEMEALTAVSAASLTLYDMLKSIDKNILIKDIKLLEKTGGKSGTYRRTSE